MLWTISVTCLLLAGLIIHRRFGKEEKNTASDDAGLAILEFGRAFPGEAIREVISTANGRTFFLRLHDGKAGCMHAHGQHFSCHLIEPGTVHVTGTGDRRLTLQFAGRSFEGGTFEFRTENDAAEVLLWLLGSFMPHGADHETSLAGGER